MTPCIEPRPPSVLIGSQQLDGFPTINTSYWPEEDDYTPSLRGVAAAYPFHKTLMESGSSSGHQLVAVSYLRVSPTGEFSAPSSAKSLSASAAKYYEQIENQLSELLNSGSEEDQVIEEGAARSALALVDHLKKHNLAPPELSWHGGDAVVMLWSLGKRTYAITVTEGELGYVVRENRKAVRMADSISVDAFRLEDLR